MDDSQPILLFDSNCLLCVRFKQALQRLDVNENINYIPVGTDWVYEKYPEIDREESQTILHFIDENGKVFRGGEITPALASQFPGINKLAWLLETDVGKKVSNFFYDKVNELRKSTVLTKNCPSCRK